MVLLGCYDIILCKYAHMGVIHIHVCICVFVVDMGMIQIFAY